MSGTRCGGGAPVVPRDGGVFFSGVLADHVYHIWLQTGSVETVLLKRRGIGGMASTQAAAGDGLVAG